MDSIFGAKLKLEKGQWKMAEPSIEKHGVNNKQKKKYYNLNYLEFEKQIIHP